VGRLGAAGELEMERDRYISGTQGGEGDAVVLVAAVRVVRCRVRCRVQGLGFIVQRLRFTT
jgi:hypothetical protein